MLKIRLQRRGKKKQAFFRIVLQEHTEKLQGKYQELLGSYDPHSKELKVDKDRVEYWVSKGAQVSATLNNLMVNHKVWDREKVKSWRPKIKEQTEEAAKPVEAAPAVEKAQEGKGEPEQKAAEKSKEEAAPESKEEAKPSAAESSEDTDTTAEAAPAVV